MELCTVGILSCGSEVDATLLGLMQRMLLLLNQMFGGEGNGPMHLRELDLLALHMHAVPGASAQSLMPRASFGTKVENVAAIL